MHEKMCPMADLRRPYRERLCPHPARCFDKELEPDGCAAIRHERDGSPTPLQVLAARRARLKEATGW